MSDILLLGDPRLRQKCEAVTNFHDLGFIDGTTKLKNTLEEFRASHGFGRGIAAPQIGIGKRFIAIHLGGTTLSLVNPTIRWRSSETFSMWDDCMSFPDLLVRVKRHMSISIAYQDEKGNTKTWDNLAQPASELLQHEIDHLDGILAIDRAIDKSSIVYRKAFDRDRHSFEATVDYIIRPI